MEPRRRNPLRRYPTAVCISVWHFGLTQSKTRALNSPGWTPLVGQFGGMDKLGSDVRQAASLSFSGAQYASSGERPASVE